MRWAYAVRAVDSTLQRPGVIFELARPPGARVRPRRAIGKTVAIHGDADGFRWLVGERILREQRRHGIGVVQHAEHERLGIAAAAITEEQEPELEIHAGLMRRDERRRPIEPAGFVAKLVGSPRDAVVGALEDRLAPDERHARE